MIKGIVATDLYGTIGKYNGLPWPRIRTDMRYFREQTSGFAVYMGRATWDSLGRAPLKGRMNVVFSRELPAYAPPGEPNLYFVNDDPREMFIDTEVFAHPATRWIIGGKQIFEQCAGLYDEFHHTLIGEEFAGDVVLDLDKTLEGMTLVSEDKWHDEDTNLNGVFRVYRRQA